MVSATLHRTGARAEYRVVASTEAERAAVAAMGFAERDGCLSRTFPDSEEVPRIFANFEAHLDRIVRIKLREVPAPWAEALELAADRLSGEVGWWLTGSAALAVRGIDVRPRDVDLVVDDAERAGALLPDLLVEPVFRAHGWVADWFGRAFAGCLVEWVAGVHAEARLEAADGWRERVTWRGRDLLVSPLDLQLAVAEHRGLQEQADALRRRQLSR